MGVAEQRSCCMLCKTRHIGKACMSYMRHRRWPMRCVVTTWTRWTPRGWTATMTYEENMVMYATLILSPSAWYGKGVGNAGFASTPLSAGTETSGVQDCVSGTPIAYVNSTDVLICRHSTCLWAWSSSSPLIVLYRTLAVPRTRTTLCDRSFAVAGPRVWNSLLAARRQITSYGQFRQHPITHLFRV